jgi:hypothetical protein
MSDARVTYIVNATCLVTFGLSWTLFGYIWPLMDLVWLHLASQWTFRLLLPSWTPSTFVLPQNT